MIDSPYARRGLTRDTYASHCAVSGRVLPIAVAQSRSVCLRYRTSFGSPVVPDVSITSSSVEHRPGSNVDAQSVVHQSASQSAERSDASLGLAATSIEESSLNAAR